MRVTTTYTSAASSRNPTDKPTARPAVADGARPDELESAAATGTKDEDGLVETDIEAVLDSEGRGDADDDGLSLMDDDVLGASVANLERDFVRE